MISATRLFVGNLPENTEANDLHAAFSVFGQITNLDLKSKPGDGNESKKFAFVSISAANPNVESCIKHFANEDFKGSRLYVTRARESFLERLQRERELTQIKESEKNEQVEKLPTETPTIRLSDKLNPRKRKIEQQNHTNELNHRTQKHFRDGNINEDEYSFKNNHNQNTKRPLRDDKQNSEVSSTYFAGDASNTKNLSIVTEADKKKHAAEMKRQESMKKKRQEFKEKKMIIKSGLTGVDKVQNKKVIFSDSEDYAPKIESNNNKTKRENNQNSLFDDNAEESDEELNFEVKKQYEGKKGQKVLDLQSRYKSDKRFTLGERFIDDDEEEEGPQRDQGYNNEEVVLGTADEKATQMNILQDVLGITIKQKYNIENDNRKSKPNLGMLRFDPLQPDHAKFLVPVETKPETAKKSKKKNKEKQEDVKEVQPEPEGPKIEVSKEQFYKVSDALKEAIAQPSTFSLRSLFGSKENEDEVPLEQETDYIPLEAPKAKKVKNPLDRKEKNPFVYDSSESEDEEADVDVKTEQQPAATTEVKAVWKENLFFAKFDSRLKEGLAFFSKAPENEIQKERRELKSLMKKRMYNNDRKNQMFKKKIGGKKKSMKKPYKNKS